MPKTDPSHPATSTEKPTPPSGNQRNNSRPARQQSSTRLLPVSDRYLFAIILFLLSSLILYSGFGQRLDYVIYDSFLKTQPMKTSSASVIVAIDEKSLQSIGKWPWSRDTHALLVKRLKAAGAEVIVFDILLTDSGDPTADKALAAAIGEAGNVILPMHLDTIGTTGLLSEILPLPSLVKQAASLGHVQIELDSDGIARGLYLYEGLDGHKIPTLALAAYQFQQGTASRSHEVPLKVGSQPHEMSTGTWNVREGYRLIPYQGPPGSLPTISYSDVITSQLPPDYFKDRVVFVGATAAGLGDVLATPVSGQNINMAGAELHANFYEGLHKQAVARILENEWTFLLTFCFVMTTALLFPRLSPGRNLLTTIGLILIVLLFTFLLLRYDHHWYPPAATLLTLAFAYPYWSWRRLTRLNSFLNYELERLSAEPALTRSSIESPQLWAQQLAQFIKPANWEFEPAQESGKEPYVVESSDTCAVFLPVQGQVGAFNLRLTLAGDAPERNRLAEYILALYPRLPQPKTPHHAARELIERRIEQVQKAINTMQELRQFIGDTVSHMPEGVMVGDEMGRLLYVNEPARKWLREEADVGEYIPDLMPVSNTCTTPFWDDLVKQVLVNGKRQQQEVYSQDSAVLVALVPIHFQGLAGNGLIVNFSDIQPIHEAQQKRLEMIHFVSHDLRSPLASQLALLSSLRRDIPENMQSHLDEALRLTEKSLFMSEQFLQLSRVEAAEHIEFYPCDLIDIVDNALDSLAPQAREQQVKLNFETQEEALPIRGNADLLERAVLNLLQNALNHSPPGTSIDCVAERLGQQLVLHIQDQGPGIAASEIPKLFTAFRRTQASERNGVKGSGLGLRLVQLVLQRHNGQIEVISEVGKGARFTITLPGYRLPSND